MTLHAWIGCALLLVCCTEARSDSVRVIEIEVEGIRRTRINAVLRELDFSIGDTLSLANLTERLHRNRANLLNTALFSDAILNIKEWNHAAREVSVQVEVKEAWYIYAFPIVELADRNFNVWWEEHNRDFGRLNIGIYAKHINLTGIGDRLKVRAQTGFSPRLEIEYQMPYFNKARTLGWKLNVLWSANKEVAFDVVNNKQLFYPGDFNDESNQVFRRLRIQTGLRYRPNLYFIHELEAGYYDHQVDEQIAFEANPDFFLSQRTHQHYFLWRYQLSYDHRDLQLFPMRGLAYGIEVIKEGSGNKDDINTLSLTPYLEYNIPLTGKITCTVGAKGQYGALRDKQPFWNYQGLGYGNDYVRGYELYVMNGIDFVYTKTSFKFKLLDRQINWKRKMPGAFREMPVQLYGTLNHDTGYVNDPFYADGNPLVNRVISGGGPGLAIVIHHTLALHLEYSFNDVGENGLFLHTKTSF